MELSESIIDRLQQGEKQLFGQLIEMYQDRVYGLSFQLMKNEDDANEVAQNTFIKIYKKIKLYKGTSYNEAMTQLKAKKRWVFGFFDHERNEETAPPEVLDQLNQEEQRNQVQWALSQLKSSERLVMNLFYLEELSYEEITVITNLSLANVKVKLHRSKKKLKRLLAPQEFAQRA